MWPKLVLWRLKKGKTSLKSKLSSVMSDYLYFLVPRGLFTVIRWRNTAERSYLNVNLTGPLE